MVIKKVSHLGMKMPEMERAKHNNKAHTNVRHTGVAEEDTAVPELFAMRQIFRA
jgi:hypothetical protein